MTRLLKVTFIAAAAVVGIGSSAFAQSFNPEVGTGNITPFSYAPTTTWTYVASTRYDRHVASRHHHNGLGAYAMIDRRWGNPNDPSRTGGGSLGYNENLYNY